MNARYISARVRSAVIAKSRGCFYCGTAFGPFELDHFKPFCEGGSAAEDNIVLACFSCNRTKGGRSPSILLRQQADDLANRARELRRKANELSARPTMEALA